ncbi:MAG: LysR family transcriptional regulator [Pseudomonadota bacterium]
MRTWTEMRTALLVAQTGTVTQASKQLGLHRATVNRHIDFLESQLGVRLFIRHRQGYQLTDAGVEFLTVAGRAYDMLDDFAGRARVSASELSGEVIVTTLFPISSLIMPALVAFRRQNPATRVALKADDALFKLEHADAHVAIRVGTKPAEDDYVVQPYFTLAFGLFAHEDYIARQGAPAGFEDLARHEFVGALSPGSSAPFRKWLLAHVPPERIVLYTTNAFSADQAICAGAGIGFAPIALAARNPALRQVVEPKDHWRVPVWLVSHVDMHRTEKVQAMLGALKALETGIP